MEISKTKMNSIIFTNLERALASLKTLSQKDEKTAALLAPQIARLEQRLLTLEPEEAEEIVEEEV